MIQIATSNWFQSMRSQYTKQHAQQQRSVQPWQYGTEYVLKDGKLQERFVVPAFISETFKATDPHTVVLQRAVLVLFVVLVAIYLFRK